MERIQVYKKHLFHERQEGEEMAQLSSYKNLFKQSEELGQVFSTWFSLLMEPGFFFPSRRQWIWARSTENPIFGQGHIPEQEILCGPAGGSVRRKCGNHMETILRIRRKEKSKIDNIPELKSFWKRWTSIIVQLSLLLITLMTRRRSRKMSQEQKTLSKWTSSS